jgi:hypothetical protein
MPINTGDYIQYKRWDEFHFYETSVAVNSTAGINTELQISVLWKLAELRLHFSTALVSDMTLAARISSIINSSLNQRLISQAMVGVQDLTVHYSDPLLFFSNDTLLVTTSTISVTNLVGIEATGWAVRG